MKSFNVPFKYMRKMKMYEYQLTYQFLRYKKNIPSL
jgi:hypothetical protein